MSASRRLQPAVEQAQHHADDAARNVVESQKKVKNRKQQLGELIAYREDYTNGLRHKSRVGLNAARMQDYSLFLERLNTAIEQVQLALDNANRELSASKRVLLEKVQRASALESVVTRHRQSERQAQSRREQNESDEHAQRIRHSVFS